MKNAFVDTSGFYALLDAADPFHERSKDCFLQAESEGWLLLTSNYVVHETWALIQARLGWQAVEDWLRVVLPRCEVVWIAQPLFDRAAARCRQTQERRLSLTDCTSFEVMLERGCKFAIADDEHFRRLGFDLPDPRGDR